jgi:hypothetical protein
VCLLSFLLKIPFVLDCLKGPNTQLKHQRDHSIKQDKKSLNNYSNIEQKYSKLGTILHNPSHPNWLLTKLITDGKA